MPETEPPAVYVDLICTPVVRRRLSRPQKWRWIAKNAGNHKILARSSESYTNVSDALDAIDQLFGAQTDVWLRQPGEGNQLLRMAVEP